MRRAVALLLLVSCDGVDGSSDPDPAVVPTVIDPSTSGAIRGVVRFKGAPPPNPRLSVGGSPECSIHHSGDVRDEIVLVKDGRLRNAFVYVKAGLEKHVFAWPPGSARISHRGCLYTPRVAGAQLHQTVEFYNDDPSDHNVHGYTSDGQFNRMLRGKGASTSLKLRRPEVMVKLRCDLHPWMLGWLGVVPHPFFAVTGEDGTFAFSGLPPGEYEIAVWHEVWGERTSKVVLGPKGEAAVDYVFPP